MQVRSASWLKKRTVARDMALGLTLTVLVAGYIAFRFGGLGGADGKLATVVAAVSPLALALSGLLLLAGFIINRLRGRPGSLPAAPFFLAAAIIILLLLFIQPLS